MGGSLFPPCWLFGLRCPSPGARGCWVCRVLMSPGELTPVSWYLCHQGFYPCNEPEPSLPPHTHAAFAGYPLRPAGRPSIGSCEVTTVLGLGVHETLWVPSKLEFLFLLVLWNSCSQSLLAFKAKCSGVSSWCQAYRQGSLAGAQNSQSCGRDSVMYFPVFELPIQLE